MSGQYSHILLASDLLDDNIIVADKAKALAQQNGARLSVIHAFESMPLYFGNEMVIPDTHEIEEELRKQAENKMSALADKLGIDKKETHVSIGITKFEILDFAREHNVDLIVIGSHSRHGLEHLIGSTARAILNAAPCDVLAVKITKP